MMQSDSRMLKKFASCVHASLKGSTYGLGKRLFRQAMGGRVEKYTIHLSARCGLGCEGARLGVPGRAGENVAFLNILRGMPVPFEAGCRGVSLDRSKGFSTTF